MKYLSIIVPMFNVEPYVERCLRSLEDQNIPKDDYEIICINDGSPDDSRSVVIGMQKEFDNIILIDQNNQGVSCARNNGIDKAKGKYLLFIDPDDYVDTNSFSRIVKNADKWKAQISFLGFTILKEDGTISSRVWDENYTSQAYEGVEAYYIARGDGLSDPDRMVAVLFKTEFLNQNNLRYLSDVPFLEDGEFISRILCLAERCIFDGHSFYQRTTRPGSATHSNLFYSEKAAEGFLLAASNLKRFQHEQNINEKQNEFLNQPIFKFILLYIRTAIRRPYFSNFVVVNKALKANNLFTVNLSGIAKSYQKFSYLFNHFKLFFLIESSIKRKKEKVKNFLLKK